MSIYADLGTILNNFIEHIMVELYGVLLMYTASSISSDLFSRCTGCGLAIHIYL